MPLITRPLVVDQIARVGGVLQLEVEVDPAAACAWSHNNAAVPNTGPAHEVNPVGPEHAGVWTVVVTKGAEVESSSATVFVVEAAGDAPTFVWHPEFATRVGLLLAIVGGVVALLIGARLVWLLGTRVPGAADAALVAGVLALAGLVALLLGAFLAAVEVRGRARDPGPGAAAALDVTGEDVEKVINALGRLRGSQLLVVAGLLALSGAGLLGWQLVDAPPPVGSGDPPAVEQTPAAEPTPTVT